MPLKLTSTPCFIHKLTLSIVTVSTLLACSPKQSVENMPEQVREVESKKQLTPKGKPVVYQVLPRLFGNTNNTNKPWGSIKDNGVGKFSDFNDAALEAIKAMGTSHIWYTGILHHGVITDYSEFGISPDDPDVIKGRAGSPYAVKDYYNVDPDLADDPANRLAEFESLITRTHSHGMQVIIDIVPNHVARNYHSPSHPEQDFGANDDVSVEYAVDNNFYYVVGEDFQVPQGLADNPPLGGAAHPLADGKFIESPAKWTGNGSRMAQPKMDDWYETVKINYGVRPDGSYDFARLPDEYHSKDYAEHAAFWVDKKVPDSWRKYRDIALFWLSKGVDGFRYDVAELVPVEFWSYMNSSIKQKNPEAFLMAEVYNPGLYRDFIQLGKMDYLYDKVETYDTLKAIIQGKAATGDLDVIQANLQDIDMHMLNFLENHDEQRIASPEFAGSANKGKPAMVVSMLINRAAGMLYFAQDVGEDGSEDPGFGDPSRTSIFDYAGVPAHQRWMNGGKFDGAKSTLGEQSLHKFYQRLLNISAKEIALQGQYASLHKENLAVSEAQTKGSYDQRLYSFVRWNDGRKLIVISNFDAEKSYQFDLQLPTDVIQKWSLADGEYQLTDLLTEKPCQLTVSQQQGEVPITLAPLQSFVFELN